MLSVACSTVWAKKTNVACWMERNFFLGLFSKVAHGLLHQKYTAQTQQFLARYKVDDNAVDSVGNGVRRRGWFSSARRTCEDISGGKATVCRINSTHSSTKAPYNCCVCRRLQEQRIWTNVDRSWRDTSGTWRCVRLSSLFQMLFELCSRLSCRTEKSNCRSI